MMLSSRVATWNHLRACGHFIAISGVRDEKNLE